MSVKHTMGEIRLSGLGIETQFVNSKGERVRYGRNTLYNMLRQQGYEWSPKYLIWVKVQNKEG